MEVYDLIMLAILALTTLFGAWKGLAWQIASLSSIFVSFYIASRFRTPVAAMIDAQPPWNMFLAMLILYLGSSLAIWTAFRLVSQLIDQVKLREFDRHAGAVAGLARGGLWCVIITLFAVTLMGEVQQQAIVRSQSGYYIALLLDRAHPVMPEELHDVLAPYIHTLDARLEPEQRRSHSGAGEDPAAVEGPGASELSPPQAGPQASDSGGDAVQRWLQKLPQSSYSGR